MEKRVFLAIFLSFVVLVVYQAIFPPVPLPTDAPEADAPVPTAAAPAAPASPEGVVGAEPVEELAPAQTTPAAKPIVGDSQPREVVVETDTVRAVFSNVGATLQSWKLKHYLDDGEPLELVPRDVPDSLPRPFTLSTDDPAISRLLATALFTPSSEGLSLGASSGTLSFEYRDASGLTARKAFYFRPEGRPYVLKVEAAVDIGGTSRPVTIAWGPGLGLGYSPDGGRQFPVRVVQFERDDVTFLSADDVAEEGHHEGELRFAGVEDHYFLSAVLPGTQRVAVDYTPIALPVPGDATETRNLIAYSVSVPDSFGLPFFLGPKDFDVLRAVDTQLVRAIDFGMFSVLVVPLLLALKWLNGFIGNYGWSIVALTVLINLAIFPLRHRSMVSMRKMQALQPEVKAIQERYAKFKLTDPERQKMNQEMMALYKQKGVNPASGCVPMLLTLPILFAFYSMLWAAIELRGAPFVGWIDDLSQRDPLYITPLLMGGSQFLQMRMSPTTADPIQQKIFMMMPVIFTVSFLWFPAGLVLYWLTSNLMAIGQQYVTNRIIGVPVRPARAKTAGNARPTKSASKS
jgi:YidC/Oxa1 family membrane protein insertase